MAGTRRGGEQPAGAGLHAAQDPRAERRCHDTGARLPIQFDRSSRRRSAAARRRSAPASVESDETQASKARTNLPSRVPALYGRADDLAAIAALLREHPVVTITGSGGIGKTRVAQAVANRIMTEAATDYPDGVWWVELASLADGALVPLGRGSGDGNPRRATRPRRSALQSELATKRALLVLDNCEHLADAVAALVDAVTAGAPRVSILVTSQETLRADRRARVPLWAGLRFAMSPTRQRASQSGAVELFAARAQAVDPRFTLTATNLPAVIEILQAPGRHSTRHRARGRAASVARRGRAACAPARAL